MAKNIEINIKGSDGNYEVLYPKTNSSTTVINQNIINQFGLAEGSGLEDVLGELGKYNEYWWRRRVAGGEKYVENRTDITANKIIYLGSFDYGHNITINQNDGTYTIVKEGKYTINSWDSFLSAMQDLSSKLPCYVYGGDYTTSNYKWYYIPENANWANVASTDGTFCYYNYFDDDYSCCLSGYASVKAQTLSTKKTKIETGEWSFLHSINKDAYSNTISYFVSIGNTISTETSIGANGVNSPIEYSTEVYCDDGENILLKNSNDLSISGKLESRYEILKGKYIKIPTGYTGTGYISPGVYYLPSNVTFSVSSNTVVKVDKYNELVINKYQDYEFEFLGQPLQKIPECFQYDFGSYVGTGSSTVANQLVFNFSPKIIFIRGIWGRPNTTGSTTAIFAVMNGYASGAVTYGVSSITFSGGTVENNTFSFGPDTNTWSASSNVGASVGNKSGETYYYLAIG